MRPTFQAKYTGRCRACGSAIEIGDTVTYDSESGVLVHGLCEDTEVEPLRRAICPSCFTEVSVSGACMC